MAMVSLPNGTPLSAEVLAELLVSLAKAKGCWENIQSLPPTLRLQTLKHTWPTHRDCAEAVAARITLQVTPSSSSKPSPQRRAKDKSIQT